MLFDLTQFADILLCLLNNNKNLPNKKNKKADQKILQENINMKRDPAILLFTVLSSSLLSLSESLSL